MEDNGKTNKRKCIGKRKKAFYRIARDMDITCCDEPTQVIFRQLLT